MAHRSLPFPVPCPTCLFSLCCTRCVLSNKINHPSPFPIDLTFHISRRHSVAFAKEFYRESLEHQKKRKMLFESTTGCTLVGKMMVIGLWYLFMATADFLIRRWTRSLMPLAVVQGESMLPTLHPGDLVYSSLRSQTPLQVGEVIIYQLPLKPDIIIHRIVQIQLVAMRDECTECDSHVISDQILTQGDNTDRNDRYMYQPVADWLHYSDILGRVRLRIPHLGHLIEWNSKNPWFWYGILAIYMLI